MGTADIIKNTEMQMRYILCTLAIIVQPITVRRTFVCVCTYISFRSQFFAIYQIYYFVKFPSSRLSWKSSGEWERET